MEEKTNHLEEQFEEAVGNLYAVMFRMHQAGLYQLEYDNMGTLMNMITQDRQMLRQKYNVKE